MIRFRRRGLALLGTAALTAATVGVAPAAMAAPSAARTLAAQGTPFGSAGLAAYGTGSELSISALNSGSTQLARVDQAFSAITAAAGGLGPALTDPQTGAVVQPALPASNASARGSGAEVGLGLSAAQANQIQLGIAQSHSPPPNQVGTIAGPEVAAVPLVIPGVLRTGVLHGFATSNYLPGSCPIGQPIAFGLGSAAAPTNVLNTIVGSPGAAQSATRSDLVANPDGTFGLQTLVTETIAPVVVTLAGAGTATPTKIELTVQGASPGAPVTLAAATDGEGHSTFVLGNAVPTVTLQVTTLGIAAPPITLSLATLAPLLNTITTALHAVAGLAGLNLTIGLGDGVHAASPLKDANGNVVFANSANAISASYDLLTLHASLGSTVLADLRVGHMEAYAALPTGSISCTVPVGKVSSSPTVQAGNTFTWTISVPSSAAAVANLSCDLTNIKVTDKIKVNSGSPTFTIGTISNGGVYNSATSTITWVNIGTYHPGDPPKQLTVQVTIPSGSAAGVLEDTATVTAGLGACAGSTNGIVSLVGNVSNVIVGGSATLIAPQITTAAGGTGSGLAATGTGPLLPWVATGLVLMAYASRRLVRRVRSDQ